MIIGIGAYQLTLLVERRSLPLPLPIRSLRRPEEIELFFERHRTSLWYNTGGWLARW